MRTLEMQKEEVEMAEEQQRIVLLDDEGQEHGFTMVDSLQLADNLYVVLLPETDPEHGAVIFRVDTDEEGEERLSEIEDDDEFDRVVEALEQDDEPGDDELQ